MPTMIHLLKFFHIIFALSLLGMILYCLFAIVFQKSQPAKHKILLGLSVFALLTGSLLVLPKHYTFTTPWIQAAIVLILLFALCVAGLLLLKKNEGLKQRWLTASIYLFLLILLVIIIHDAVTKSTFLL